MRLAVWTTVLSLAAPGLAVGKDDHVSKPWWERQKIRFFWGWWQSMDVVGVPIEETMKNLTRVGATVFADMQHASGDRGLVWDGAVTYSVRTARAAHQQGIRYFASAWGSGISSFAKGINARPSMDPSGNPYKGRVQGDVSPCPLDISVYEQCFVAPVLKLLKDGLADGLHLDWERYVGRGEAGTCYCDECFKSFLKQAGKSQTLPKPEERGKWIDQHHLEHDYAETYRRRRKALFRHIERTIHAVHPTFVFSGYYITHDASTSIIAESLHTPEVPFFVVDDRHYYEAHTRPWWESLDQHFRDRGYVRIAGTYDATFFGGEPTSEVSLSQWMYDAAMHSDGVWPYFEQELTPDFWRSVAVGNRRISTTEANVGKFLRNGKQDPHFITPVEWSGSPELRQKIKHVSYHLGDEHLVHVNNVDTDRPVKLLLRFGRLSKEWRWTVKDPISGLYYSPDGKQVQWDSKELFQGLVVSLAKRSDLFLLLSPQVNEFEIPRSRLIASELTRIMPDHPKTEPPTARSRQPAGKNHIAYLATRSLGYDGTVGSWAIGNRIFSINANGESNKQLYGLKGYLWEPTWSPDGTRIAFTCYTNGQGQIFVMNADGSEVVNVSENGYCDRSPAWSPNGHKLTFVSDRHGDWEIYVMNADGSSQVQLTNCPGTEDNPVWSPDGTRIAFESNRAGDVDIYTMNPDGTHTTNLTDRRPGNETGPAWSPDSSRIACSGTGRRTRRELLVVGAEGDVKIVIRYGGYFESIRWSPDGRHVASVFDGGVLICNPDEIHGEHISQVIEKSKVSATHDPIRTLPVPRRGHRLMSQSSGSWYATGSSSPRWLQRYFGGLSWSPEGNRLAFSSNMDDGYFYVYILSTDAGELKRLDASKSAWLQEISWRP